MRRCKDSLLNWSQRQEFDKNKMKKFPRCPRVYTCEILTMSTKEKDLVCGWHLGPNQTVDLVSPWTHNFAVARNQFLSWLIYTYIRSSQETSRWISPRLRRFFRRPRIRKISRHSMSTTSLLRLNINKSTLLKLKHRHSQDKWRLQQPWPTKTPRMTRISSLVELTRPLQVLGVLWY